MKEPGMREAMDGSPAHVTTTLGDLAQAGKFAGMELEFSTERYKPVIDITFQCGPLKEVGVNGCSIEDVIDVLVARLEGFQHGQFACAENFQAISALKVAKFWLLERTAKRQQQGVEGTMQAHVS